MKSTTNSTNTVRVTVIIPVYNVKEYLQRCLNSLYAQTFQAFTILAVDDGSTDNSLHVLRENAKVRQNLTILEQKNHGQGYARNRALERVDTDYVLFVDADDYVEPELLEKTVALADQQRADVVNFGWRKLAGSNNTSGDASPFSHRQLLSGDDCEQFLRKNNYFSWDSLYRKSFLDRYSIRFGEGYIYEDNEFIVRVASYAKKIAVVNESLYVMRYDNVSSTRSGSDTDRHYRDFILAVKRSFAVFRPRSEYSSFYLAAYFLEKFIVYYQQRVPQQYRKDYLHDFVDTMHGQKISPPHGGSYRFLRSCIVHSIFADRRYRLFYLELMYKTKLLPAMAKWRKLQRKQSKGYV